MITHARVVRNAEWDEYIVKMYVTVNGRYVRYPEGDYFTSDKADAYDTRQAVIYAAAQRGE